LASLALLAACRREAIDENPERLVAEFILRMQRVHGDARAGRAAFELLYAPAQKNLTERTTRATALVGRKVAPEEMLAPTRFSLAFTPRRISAQIHGETADVTLQAAPPSLEHREIRCVREAGHWRIALELPPLSPIQRRKVLESGE